MLQDLLKWILAFVSSIMLLLGWGSENEFHFFLYIFLCPLLFAENSLAISGFIKYALGLLFLVSFHLLAGMNLVEDILLF